MWLSVWNPTGYSLLWLADDVALPPASSEKGATVELLLELKTYS